MAGALTLLVLLLIVGLLWGLINPEHLRETIGFKRVLPRKHYGLGLGLLIMLWIIVVVGLSVPTQSKTVNTTLSASKATTINTPKVSPQPTVTMNTTTSTQSVAFTTKTEDDSSLTKGQTKIIQTGQNGTETLTYNVTYTNGKQTNEALVSTVVTTQPVQEIVEDGTYVAPAPTTAPSSTSTPSPAPTTSCHPLSDENTCYEPGEYCREADAGMTGVAGNGGSIICEDNDGLRWEPR
jgi:hypothetical protein